MPFDESATSSLESAWFAESDHSHVPDAPRRRLADSVVEELWFADDVEGDATAVASASLAAAVASLTEMKTFPAVAQKTMALLASRDYAMADVVSTIESDPSLAAGVLRVANSPMFRGQRAISSVREAAVRLGAKTVGNVVMGVATMSLFPDPSGVGRAVRDHCVGVAALAQALAWEVEQPVGGDVFLPGLLHDIAKLFLMETGEFAYDDASNTAPKGNPLHLHERDKLGFDHAVLGGHILQAWQLPWPVPQLVAWHHQPARAYEHPELAGAVAALRVAEELDAIAVAQHDDPDPFLERAAESADAAWLGLSGRDLVRRWELLFRVRAESMTLFG